MNDLIYELPTLYHRSKAGKVSEWTIAACFKNNIPHIITIYGYVDGAKQNTAVRVDEGKNLGKANETTAWEQACSMAKSKWEKQKLGNYRESLEEDIKLLPMLAHKYQDHKKKVNFPCYIQPKLNGCLHHLTKIITDKGVKTIGEIVDNNLRVNVLSFNHETGNLEFKPVVNWFNNGEAHVSDWIELQLDHGDFIKCTLDHKIFTTNGWVQAKDLDESKDLICNSASRLKSLLCGTILGDSTLRIEPTYNSYRLSFSHSNEEYFKFKTKILGLEGSISNGISGFGSEMLTFSSKALTKTDFPIELFYNFNSDLPLHGKRKVISLKTLKRFLTPQALSLWIADDGSLNLNNGNPNTPILSIAVMRYPEEQVRIFEEYFTDIWNCTPKLQPHKRDEEFIGYSLNFTTKDTLYILNQLRFYHCKGVEYKFYFPTQDYLPPLKKVEFSQFKKRKLRHINNEVLTRYDIEIKDNHNYFANGMLVHNCRVLALIKEDTVEYWSRKGKEYETLHHWDEELREVFPVGTILDGEAYNPNLGFQEIIRRVKRVKTSRHDIEDDTLQYWIYDVVQPMVTFEQRRMFLTWYFSAHLLDSNVSTHKSSPTSTITAVKQSGFHHLVLCPTFQVFNEKELVNLHKYHMKDGFEGTIIRTADGIYQVNYRSYGLLKYKDFLDEEFKIVGGVSAKGKDEGTVIFECELSSGTRFKVRPKGSFEQRKEYFDNLNQYLGKMLTVRYQEKSEDGVPIFPVGLEVRDYE